MENYGFAVKEWCRCEKMSIPAKYLVPSTVLDWLPCSKWFLNNSFLLHEEKKYLYCGQPSLLGMCHNNY